MNAKLFLSLVMCAGLANCSNIKLAETPVQQPEIGPLPGSATKLKNYEAMDSERVLVAQRNCILNRMIPVSQAVHVRTEYGTRPVTVGVSCVAP
jgi:hypothetical protein